MIDLMPVATGPPVPVTNGGDLSPPEPSGGTFAEILKAQTAPAIEADMANSPPAAPGGGGPDGAAELLALQYVPEPEGLLDHPVEADPLQQIAAAMLAIPSIVFAPAVTVAAPAATAAGGSSPGPSVAGVGNAPNVSGSLTAEAPPAAAPPTAVPPIAAPMGAAAEGAPPADGGGKTAAIAGQNESAPHADDLSPAQRVPGNGEAAAIPGGSVTRSARAVEVLQAVANGEKPPPVQAGAPPSGGSPQPTTATAPAADDSASPAAALPVAGAVIETQGVQGAPAPSDDAAPRDLREGRPAGGDPAAAHPGAHAGAAGSATVVRLGDASVGEAAAAPRLLPSPPALAEQVVVSVRLLRLTGREEIRLRLEPPDLGTVHVRVVEQDGRLTVQLRAEHGLTADAVQQALPQLRQALQQAQVAVQHLDVALGDASSFSAGQPQHEQGDAPGASASDGIVEDEEPAERPLDPTLPGGHQVDYRA